VWFQIFNEFNARKLGNELNVFDGLSTNKLFIAVIFITIFVQVLVVEFGGYWVFTTGLDWRDWLVCIFFWIFVHTIRNNFAPNPCAFGRLGGTA